MNDDDKIIPEDIWSQESVKQEILAQVKAIAEVLIEKNKKYGNSANDGMVSHESAKFGNYRGDMLDVSLSHGQMVDFASKRRQKPKIYEFYKKTCRELEELENETFAKA